MSTVAGTAPVSVCFNAVCFNAVCFNAACFNAKRKSAIDSA
jgi:hypothetical protein